MKRVAVLAIVVLASPTADAFAKTFCATRATMYSIQGPDVFGFGLNEWGVILGQTEGANVVAPVMLTLLEAVTSVSCSWQDVCFVEDTTGVKCAGKNVYGNLGDGTTVSYSFN
jgi:hypothetical protein